MDLGALTILREQPLRLLVVLLHLNAATGLTIPVSLLLANAATGLGAAGGAGEALRLGRVAPDEATAQVGSCRKWK